MGLIIDDGRGRGFSASVSESNRFNVSAKTASRAYYVSRNDSQAFSLVSIDGAAAAGDIICYLKNNSSTRNLFMGETHVSAVETVLWKAWAVTGTAAGSSALTSVNLNLSAGIAADTTARGNGAISGLTTGNLLHMARSVATGQELMDFSDSLILGPGDAIGIEYDTGTGGIAEVTMEFHFENLDRKN